MRSGLLVAVLLFALRGLAAEPCKTQTLVVSFEGGEVADNLAAALAALREVGILPVKIVPVQPGDTIETIYKASLNAPGHSLALTKLASQLNDANLGTKLLHPGDTVKVPDVTLTLAHRTVRYDRSDPHEVSLAIELRKHWRPWVQSSSSPKDDAYVSVTFTIYRLSVTGCAADILASSKNIGDRHLANTFVEVVSADGQAPPQFSLEEAKVFRKHALGQTHLPWGDEGDLGQLINRPSPEKVDSCGARCPEVVLLDSIPEVHPDIAAALDSSAPAIVPAAEQEYEEIDPSQASHATHLAGIIGARVNGFGFVGVDPNATIVPIDWQTLGRSGAYSKVADLLEDRAARTNPQIVVFASSWSCGKPLHTEQDALCNALAKEIQQSRLLWIVAAGPDHAAATQDINELTDLGPANLGNLDNVLVVTACDDCDGVAADPRLLTSANFSTREKLVHVVAPGVDIPSTASRTRYAVGTGTSQAAAIVGGLASLMVRRYPDMYSRSAVVKRRIEVTSLPVFKSPPADGMSIADAAACGVVDASAALLDPSMHWVRNLINVEPQAYDDLEWAVRRLDITDAEGNDDDSLAVDNILRIVSVGKDTSGAPLWAIYTRGWSNLGNQKYEHVIRRGPLRIQDTAAVFAHMKRKDGAVLDVTAGTISDLLLSRPIKSTKP